MRLVSIFFLSLALSFNANAGMCKKFLTKSFGIKIIKVAAVTAFFVAVYEPAVSYQQEKVLSENIERNAPIYSQQILYDVRFEDIKSRAISTGNTKTALKEAFWRNQNLQSYYENYLISGESEIVNMDQVQELLRYPQFQHLTRVYKERDLRVETWDNLIQVNNLYYKELALADTPTASDFPKNSFVLEIIEMKREGLLTSVKSRYILQHWLYWKKTFEELRLLQVQPEPNLTLENVEGYLLAVADGKELIPESLEELTSK